VVHNARFWAFYFRQVFKPQVKVLCETFTDRVLPAFDKIDQEAEQYGQERWDRYMSMPAADEDGLDAADLAEQANDAEIAHYEQLSAARQSILNAAVVALYHLVEQQLIDFLRREILQRSEENDARLLNLSELARRLKQRGIELESLPAWPALQELRLAANVVKHAEGNSAEKLRTCRPDLFQYPPFRAEGEAPIPEPRVYMPLAGEDLYVTPGDLQSWCQGLESVLGELADKLEDQR